MSAKNLIYETLKLVGKNRGVGKLTTRKLVGNLRTIAKYMATQGLQSIHHMRTKHVMNFFRLQIDRRLAMSTLGNYATAMRLIARRIDKPNIVPRTNAELGIARNNRYQPKERDDQKSAEIRAGLYKKAKWAGLAFDMQCHFGLRRKESLLTIHAVEHEGKKRLDVQGSKGNLPRSPVIETDQQAEILASVEEFIRVNRWTSLIPPYLTLDQGLRKFSNYVHRLGGTKEAKANLHLNRHAQAQRMKRAGKTDKQIAEHIGHKRARATKHYCR